MIIKTEKMEGAVLDFAVAKSMGLKIGASLDVECYGAWLNLDNGSRHEDELCYTPSQDWSQGGPIIEKYDVLFAKIGGELVACILNNKAAIPGPTHLVAAMRAIVKAELGETVDIPEVLCQQQPRTT